VPGLQCCLRITGKFCFARATHPGCAEGQSSLRASSFRTPWNPPLTKGERKRLRGRGCRDKSLPVFGVFPIPSISPQEWGIKGVESECAVSAGGFRSALPTLHLDSRFRGNDRPRCSPPEADREFEGVPQLPFLVPPRSKIRLRRSGGQGVEDTHANLGNASNGNGATWH
jgi:hypothetical protein